MSGVLDIQTSKMSETDYRKMVTDMVLQIYKLTCYAHELEEEIVRLRKANAQEEEVAK